MSCYPIGVVRMAAAAGTGPMRRALHTFLLRSAAAARPSIPRWRNNCSNETTTTTKRDPIEATTAATATQGGQAGRQAGRVDGMTAAKLARADLGKASRRRKRETDRHADLLDVTVAVCCV